MIPETLVSFFAANQELLWLTTLVLDLGGTLVLYRLFGKAGLQVAIATAIILANLQATTMSSQIVDTAIFTLIVWAPIVGIRTALGLGFAKYIFKLVIALIDTAFIYWAKQSFIRHHSAEA